MTSAHARIVLALSASLLLLVGTKARGEAEPVRTVSVRGRVVSSAGDEVGGALVFATQPYEFDRGWRRVGKPGFARTDQGGNFTISNLEPGRYMVFVRGGGWVSAGLSSIRSDAWNPLVHKFEASTDNPLKLVAEKAARLVVRVVDDAGNPASSMTVGTHARSLWDYHLRDFEAYAALFRVETDELGVARLDAVVPGLPVRIHVRRPALGSESKGPFELASGGVREVEVRLPATRLVTVHVTDAVSGAPIAGARLSLMAGSSVEADEAAGAQVVHSHVLLDTGVRTDVDGCARVEYVPGRNARVSAAAAGYLTWNSGGEVLALLSDDVDVVHLKLNPGRSVSGQVFVPSGADPTDVELSLEVGAGQVAGVGADEDGTFSFPNLQAGRYLLRAKLFYAGRVYAAREQVAAGADKVRVRLEPVERVEGAPGQLIVYVLGPDGNPVESCEVVLTGVGGRRTSRGFPSTGSKGGVRALEVVSGELWLDIFDVEQGRLGGTQVGPIDPRSVLTVQLERARTIKGRVISPDGSPVRGVKVTAKSPYPRTASERGLEKHARTFTDQSGRFELGGLGGITYMVECEPPEEFLIPTGVRLLGGTSGAVIRLESAPEIIIKLIDPAGAPVAGARFFPRHTDHKPPFAIARVGLEGIVSDAEGIIRVRGLDPRRLFMIDVEPPPGRDDLNAIHKEDWRMVSGTLSFGTGRELRGVVVDAGGEPIPGASVTWKREGSSWGRREVRTDAKGGFIIRSVPAHAFDVTAAVEGLLLDEHSPETRVTVAAHQQDIRLEIDKGASLAVSIDPQPGQRTSTHALFVEQPADGQRSRRLAKAYMFGVGHVTFHGLRPGKPHALWIGGLPGNRCVYETGIVASDDVHVVTTKPEREVRGEIAAPEGARIKSARVQLRDGHGIAIWCDVNGLDFASMGVPPGKWTVWVWADAADGRKFVGGAYVTPDQTTRVKLRQR